MENIRRWYLFLSSAVSLHGVTWAVIALLRNIANSGIRLDREYLALQISVIIIGLPVYLIHWLWAQRLIRQEAEEQRSALRRFYLYANLAGFLGPILANTFTFFTDTSLYKDFSFPYWKTYVVTVPILIGMFYYHTRVLSEDLKNYLHLGMAGVIRRIYILGFSAAGLIMVTAAIINLTGYFLFQPDLISPKVDMRNLVRPELVRFILGTTIWVYFWRWAQSLFYAGDGLSGEIEDSTSALRKGYLYLAIFISVIGTVVASAEVLAGYFRKLLQLSNAGDSDIREALPLIIGFGLVWLFHAYVLRQDSAHAPDVPSQTAVRRIYLYIVAAIGLGVFLAGMISDINVLLSVFARDVFFGDGIKRQLAWATSILIAGLPVWLLPWREAQAGAVSDDQISRENRRSVVRKIYLYFYLFTATMSVLAGLVFIVYQILLLVLGERTTGGLLFDLSQAISFTLIAVAILFYHGLILRVDGRHLSKEKSNRLSGFRVVVLDRGDGQFGGLLVNSIEREFPGIATTSLGFDISEAEVKPKKMGTKKDVEILANADLIISPLNFAEVLNKKSSTINNALQVSPARKLFIPIQETSADWVGVIDRSSNDWIEQTIRAIKQVLAGEPVTPSKPLGCGTAILIIIGIFVVINFLSFISSIF